jgi:hypothetical protein
MQLHSVNEYLCEYDTDAPHLITVQMLPTLLRYRCSPPYYGTDAPQLITVQMLPNLLWYR